jgi:hypothetical protein
VWIIEYGHALALVTRHLILSLPALYITEVRDIKRRDREAPSLLYSTFATLYERAIL